MRDNFIQIGRFGNVILFLVLELIAFYLIIQFNREQASIFFHSTNLLSSNIYKQYNDINDYFNLKGIADSVQTENSKLRNKQLNHKYLIFGKNDTVKISDTISHYITIPAQVTSTSINRWNNNIIIDKGTNDGLSDGMGVLGINGVVGKTRLCTRHYCSVIPLIHTKSSLSVMIGESNYFGNLEWNNTNPRILNLEGVPQHAEVKLGDDIFTSGYSFLYPKGIKVGTVTNINLPTGGNFYQIEVELVNDFAALNHVYVIKNLFKTETDSLLNIDIE